MTRMRLDENHPLVVKLERIFGLMEELGVKIEFGRYGETYVHHEGDKRKFLLLDLDDDGRRSIALGVDELPPMLEYKVIYEKEEEEASTKR